MSAALKIVSAICTSKLLTSYKNKLQQYLTLRKAHWLLSVKLSIYYVDSNTNFKNYTTLKLHESYILEE